ncbi:hypothetical protein GQ457_10G019730 [Hibiscus cannabinus]
MWRWNEARPWEQRQWEGDRTGYHWREENGGKGFRYRWNYGRNSGKCFAGNKRVFTLFVQNLPAKLHWRGLRQAFGRHGDVVDSFIAGKMDRAGKRFGFVRFSNREDAERAIERLNGFRLYGYQLSVSFARFKTRTSYWRKVRTKENLHEQGSSKKEDSQNYGKERTLDTNLEEMATLDLKRITGFIEEEALFKLNKCAVGTMASVCNTSYVEDKLLNWGFGELSIKSLGGRWFLIEFKDQGLFDFLKEQNWSYLLEVFQEVEQWSETYRIPERITWLQIEGIPLHCWNQNTFEHIAKVWGSLVALGENANLSLNGEKVTLLISTSIKKTINEVMELEAGRDLFILRVKELGLNINSAFKIIDSKNNIGAGFSKLNEHEESTSGSSSEKTSETFPANMGNDGDIGKGENLIDESSSDSSSEKNVVSSPASVGKNVNLGEDDSINTSSMGSPNVKDTEASRQVGEACTLGYPKNFHLEAADYGCEDNTKGEIEGTRSKANREEIFLGKNAAVLENSKNNDNSYDFGETNFHLGESEMQGMEDMSLLCETPEQITLGIEMKDEAVVSKTLKKVIEQVEVPAKLVEISNNYQEFRAPSSDGLSMRAREDLRDMGLGLQDKGIRVSGEENSSHSQGSNKDGCNQRSQDAVNFVNGEKNFELPELHYLTKTSKKKERKFGSLSTIQDRFLSEAEKRKRIHIKKRLKKKEIEETFSELEGRSITGSDIEARRDFLLKEAIKTLDIDKKIGIEFIGEEQEVINDMISIIEKDQTFNC